MKENEKENGKRKHTHNLFFGLSLGRVLLKENSTGLITNIETSDQKMSILQDKLALNYLFHRAKNCL